jgi:hypothetical protein
MNPAAPVAMGATARWRQVPRKWQAVMVLLAALVVAEFVISFAGALYGTPSRSILGSASSLDTSGKGTAALAQLLGSSRHAVRLLEGPLDHAALPVPGTLFVLDPGRRLSSELPAISRYLAAGGRVVLAGRQVATTLRALLGTGLLPIWQSAITGTTRPSSREPEDYAAGVVVSGGAGSWRRAATSPPSVRTLLAGPGGALALLADIGPGRLVLLASSSPLENASLARADNAAFGLDLAGPAGAAVAFDEYDHLQTSPGSGIADLPGHWQLALLLGLAAVLVWILSAARRFGPPARAERELVPPRIAHVDAVAALLASGSADRLRAGAAPLRLAARERLCRALSVGPYATDSELLAASESRGMAPELVVAILAEPRSERDLLALGRGYATLTERRRWS